MKNIYDQLEEVILPKMTDYKTDLTKHDKTAIEKSNGKPFIHFSNVTGTCLIVLIDADEYPKKNEIVPYLFGRADRHHILDQCMTMAKYLDRERYYAKWVHYFDGNALTEIDHAKAIEIVRQYTAKIENLWRNDQ